MVNNPIKTRSYIYIYILKKAGIWQGNLEGVYMYIPKAWKNKGLGHLKDHDIYHEHL